MRTTPQENIRALLCRMRRRRTLLSPRLQVETISLETPIGSARMASVIIAVPEQPIPSKLPRSRPSFDICQQFAAVTLTSVLAGSLEASGMFGMIAKITVVPGKGDEMIAILEESAADLSRRPSAYAYELVAN